mmetsp:Transcript_14419/g.51274  ORF Transcript_14419/g.51274 Transcript_14419/m.51274 type:complete len:203 (-) Transcript_14419:1-609(-)
MGSSQASVSPTGRSLSAAFAASERPRRKLSSSRAWSSSYVSGPPGRSASWPRALVCARSAADEQNCRPQPHQCASSPRRGISPPQCATSASSDAKATSQSGQSGSPAGVRRSSPSSSSSSSSSKPSSSASSGAWPVASACAAIACGAQNEAPQEHQKASSPSSGSNPPQCSKRTASDANVCSHMGHRTGPNTAIAAVGGTEI